MLPSHPFVENTLLTELLPLHQLAKDNNVFNFIEYAHAHPQQLLIKNLEGHFPLDLISQTSIDLIIKYCPVLPLAFSDEEDDFPYSLPVIDSQQNTFLHWAVKTGYIDGAKSIFQQLSQLALEQYPDLSCLDETVDATVGSIDIPNLDGHTPLHLAVLNPNPAMLNYFVEKKVPFDCCATDKDGNTPLHLAAKQDNRTAILSLQNKHSLHRNYLEKTLPFDIKNYNQETPLQLFSKALFESLVPSILIKQIPEIQDQALRYAASKGMLSCLIQILDHAQDKTLLVNQQDATGKTVIYDAIDHAQTEVVQYLLDLTVELTVEKARKIKKIVALKIKDNEGNTPLHRAYTCQNVDICKKLIEEDDLLLYITNNLGERVIDLLDKRHLSEELLPLISNILEQEYIEQEVLEWAIQTGDIATLKSVVNETNVNQLSKSQGGLINILIDSAKNKNVSKNLVEILNWLIEKKIDLKEGGYLRAMLNTTTINDENNFKIFELIASANPSELTKKNEHGKTVLDVLADRKKGLPQLMRSKIVPINTIRLEKGNTLLHWAASNNKGGTIDILCNRFSNLLNLQNEAGETALIVAAQSGYIEVVRKLKIQPTIEKDVVDRNHQTFSDYALKSSSEAMQAEAEPPITRDFEWSLEDSLDGSCKRPRLR